MSFVVFEEQFTCQRQQLLFLMFFCGFWECGWGSFYL